MVSRFLIQIAVIAWIASGCLETEDCKCDSPYGECRYYKKQDSSQCTLPSKQCLMNCRKTGSCIETPSEECQTDTKQTSALYILPSNGYIESCRNTDNDVHTIDSPQEAADIQTCSHPFAWFEPFLPQWKNIIISLRAMAKDISKAQEHGTHGRTILHFLVSERDIDISILKDLLDVGVDINAVDDYGQTPLHLAVISNQIKIVELLLEYGADVHYRNEAGSSALLLALILKNDNIVQALLQSSKRITTRESDDLYPDEDVDALHVAIHIGSSESIFEQLLEFGKDKETLRKCGNEWRDISVGYWQYPEFDTAKAGGNEPNVGGITLTRVGPLIHHSIHKCRKPLMKLLLNLEGQSECKDPDGATPLHVAAGCCPGVVDDLIISTSSVHEQDAFGQTPLHYAAKQGDEVVIKKLLDSGACLITKDKNDQTPIDYAESSNHTECAGLLKNIIAQEAAQELAKACSVINKVDDVVNNNHTITIQEYEDPIETHERDDTEGEHMPSKGFEIRAQLLMPLTLITMSLFML